MTINQFKTHANRNWKHCWVIRICDSFVLGQILNLAETLPILKRNVDIMLQSF